VASTIDLNADLGESFGPWSMGDDPAMLDVVTSANVACGFHAGDPLTLSRTCHEAAARGVVVGAQVGYRDLVGFGRRHLDMSPEELGADVLYQLGALDAMARGAGTQVRYVKPHGALYHTVVRDEALADAVIGAVRRYDSTLHVVGMPGSLLLEVAEEAGLVAVPEAFADRAYNPDGTLVPRGEPGAILNDPAEVAARMVRLVTEGVVPAVDGTDVMVHASSICTHGDSPGAVAMARAVREALLAAGVSLRPFAALPD
jgi:UPF0271 protein